MALEEEPVAAGNPDLRVPSHYVASVAEGKRRPSGPMGWEGRGREAGGRSWSTVKERGLWKSDMMLKSLSLIMQGTNRRTCNPQVDVLSRSLGPQGDTRAWRRSPACS